MASSGRLLRPFQYLSNRELVNLLAVSKLMTQEWFVRHSTDLLSMSQAVIGRNATEFYVKHGVAAVFSAGETVEELRNTIDSMRKYVTFTQPFSPIVDFAAEGVEDITQTREMDTNTEDVIAGIVEAGRSPYAAAAVKFTALTGNSLLRKLASLQLKSGEHLHSLGVIPSAKEGLFLGSLFPHIAPKGSRVSKAYSHPAVVRLLSELSEVDIARTQELIRRVEKIVTAGETHNVAILIDAEQSYFQPAIDSLTFDLQRAFNTKRAVVQATFQCYLRETTEKVPAYVKWARDAKVKQGVKIVRGAYMFEENRLAARAGTVSPIHPTKPATDTCYNESLATLILSMQPGDGVTVASHNPDSVKLGKQLMMERGLMKKLSGISFAQLMGMKHKLSVQIAHDGYITQKYLPWGPIGRLIPYLARRAHESFGIRDQIQEQVAQIMEELKERMGVK